jgi:TRAP-type C4-dicarboxylate transport system permease small subunit
VRMLSGTRERIAKFAGEALVAALGVFMVIYGTKLCIATWHSDIADFPTLSVGLTYLPIPIGGAITLLFVIERLLIGPPPQELEADPETAAMHSPS